MDKFQTNTARSACSPLFDMQHARALPLCWLCVEVHTHFSVHPFLCWFCFVYFFDTPVSNADESVVVGCMCVSVFFLDWFCLSKQTPGFCQHLGCINLCDNFGALCACGVSGFFSFPFALLLIFSLFSPRKPTAAIPAVVSRNETIKVASQPEVLFPMKNDEGYAQRSPNGIPFERKGSLAIGQSFSYTDMPPKEFGVSNGKVFVDLTLVGTQHSVAGFPIFSYVFLLFLLPASLVPFRAKAFSLPFCFRSECLAII